MRCKKKHRNDLVDMSTLDTNDSKKKLVIQVFHLIYALVLILSTYKRISIIYFFLLCPLPTSQ